MRAVPELHALAGQYQDVNFLSIYITEAHAKDEWPVGSKVSHCKQPKTLSERLAIANAFVKQQEVKLPLAVDTMTNSFQQEYAAWPFRFYVIQDGKMALIAQPTAETHYYTLQDLKDWLAEFAAPKP